MPLRIRALAAALLAAAACSRSSPPPVLGVSPAAASLTAGQVQQFTASAFDDPAPAVTWSVREGDAGGSVSDSGLYFSPPYPGTYHVVATRKSDPAQQGTATVTVIPAACLLPTPQSSALPPSQVIALGVHAVGETVSFTVPPGTRSVTLLQQGTEQLAARYLTWAGTAIENTVVPLTIRVDGALYYDDDVVPPADPAGWGSPDGIGSIFFGASAPWTGTVTVPNTTHMLEHVAAHGGVPSGNWSVVVNDYAEECRKVGPSTCVVGDGTTSYPAGRYDVRALLLPGPVPATGGVDLVFHVVADGLSAATAPADPSVVRMLATLSTYLGRLGIAVGAVTFTDEPAEVRARYSDVNADDSGPCGDLASLLRLSGPGMAMNVYLVHSFYSAEPGTVVGLDGTIPGPATVGGTVASGAAVSVADLRVGAATACGGAPAPLSCGADEVAYVVAHEMGHFLGLYHDTEWTGTYFDPLGDTPTCACSACATSPADCSTGTTTPSTWAMTTTECTAQIANPASPCGGGDNLMFWALGLRSKGTVTPEQGAVARASPLVQGAP